MIKRRGKFRRGLSVLASAAPSIAETAAAIWKNEKKNRWVVPLLVFLCLTGLLLVVASTVEVMAPFIYTIF
ncbi:DUF5989 family protein [Pendulispora brunnea]|uniref:DUF5989 family protein n=1 Tax=Pendulispora brunnea TaxID=2905690 RepID=A0ABZ2K0H1_9BACT